MVEREPSSREGVQGIKVSIRRCVLSHFLPRLARFYHRADALAFEMAFEKDPIPHHDAWVDTLESLKWEALFAFPKCWFESGESPEVWFGLGQAIRAVANELDASLRELRTLSNPHNSAEEFCDRHNQTGMSLLGVSEEFWCSFDALLTALEQEA